MAVDPAAALPTDAVAFLLASNAPKLVGIASLLKECVASAKVLVRGTDSQKQFNRLFGEFCRTAVVGVADIDDGLCRAAEEAGGDTHNGGQVTEASFLADVSAYIARQSNGRVVQAYLDPIVKSSMTLTGADNRNAQTVADASKSNRKRQRQPEKAPAVASQQQRHGANSVDPNGSSLGLSPCLNAQSPGALRPTSFSLDGGSPPHRPVAKLTQNPSYQPILMPWTSPLPYTHGVVLDRVVVDRHPHHAHGQTSAGGAVGAVPPSILSICSCEHPQDMLLKWDEREAILSLEESRSNPTSAPSLLGLVRTASSTSSLKAASMQPPEESPIIRPAAPPGASGALDTTAASTVFFPSAAGGNDIADATPQAFLVQLVHFGVTSVEPIIRGSGKTAGVAS